MNECALLHIPDSRYCFAVGERELVIRLRVSKEDRGAEVYLVHAPKYEFHDRRERTAMKVCYSDRLFDYYELHIILEDVRFAYVFEIRQKGITYYFSEDGLTTDYRFEESYYNFFQMPYINENDCMQVVEWMKSAVFYQIFVERFRIGDRQKDMSYINMEWGDLPQPKSFAGGDIKGITEKLDYIHGLGVNALYLTPIFDSISNHKYDIKNYKEIDSRFGSKEDFKQLVQEAHKRGIRIVLDAVFNHCSMQIKEFQDVLKKGKASPYYDWFIIDGDYPTPENTNYECFAACNYMPKLNTANSATQEFLLDIAVYWIREFDIDGWRLDVSDEVSHQFWRRFREVVKKEKKDCVIIGENWHDAYPYLMGDQYDSIMNYSFTKACLDYFAHSYINAEQMAEKLSANLMRNTEQVNQMMLNLLDTHDTHRFYTEVGRDKNRLLAAIALEMMFPGAPCIYYGTEICMEGGYDPDSRRCFDWEESHWDSYVMETICSLTGLRARQEISNGIVRLGAEMGMLKLVRTYEDSSIYLYINLTKEGVKFKEKKKSVLCSNRLEGDTLLDNGFAIFCD